MADDQVAAAAASLPPVSKDKEKVSPPLPVVPVPAAPVDDKVVKPPLAMLVHVDVTASPFSTSPPLAVVSPADNKNKTTTKTPPVVAVPILFVVCLWCVLNGGIAFAVGDVATRILNRTPCTKSKWLFRCVTLTGAAAAEVSHQLYGELLCSAAAALAATLYMLLTRTATTTRRMRSSWGAVDALLVWVALAATAALHCTQVAKGRVFLAADDAGDTYIFVDVVLNSVYLAVDLFLCVLLCCSPRRLELGEQ